jgi:hypothetical protein
MSHFESNPAGETRRVPPKGPPSAQDVLLQLFSTKEAEKLADWLEKLPSDKIESVFLGVTIIIIGRMARKNVRKALQILFNLDEKQAKKVQMGITSLSFLLHDNKRDFDRFIASMEKAGKKVKS